MPAPSQLSVAASVLTRLVKDIASYRQEYESQQARIAKLESEPSSDENAEYTLRQERKALDETVAMFPRLRVQIEEAKAKLEAQLAQDEGPGDQSSPEDITKAKDAVAKASISLQQSA